MADRRGPGAARVERVRSDKAAARRRLRQARSHLRSAQLEGLDRDSAFLLAYQAALAATDAVLAAAGRRVSEGRGAHALRIAEAGDLLGERQAQLLQTIDRLRRRRNQIAYEAGGIGTQELTAAREAARDVVKAAGGFVGR